MNHFNLFYYFLKLLYIPLTNILGVQFSTQRSYVCVQTNLLNLDMKSASLFATNVTKPQFSHCCQDRIKHCVDGEALLNRKYKIWIDFNFNKKQCPAEKHNKSFYSSKHSYQT